MAYSWKQAQTSHRELSAQVVAISEPGSVRCGSEAGSESLSGTGIESSVVVCSIVSSFDARNFYVNCRNVTGRRVQSTAFTLERSGVASQVTAASS